LLLQKFAMSNAKNNHYKSETRMQLKNVLRSSGAATLAVLALGAMALPAVAANSILFVGNSFTYGEPAGGPPIVQNYRPSSVTDLNGTNIGGVPALFKALTTEAGLDYRVSLETVGGTGVDYHYNNKLPTILRPYDTVLLQSYSTLDASKPGNPTSNFINGVIPVGEAWNRAFASGLADTNPYNGIGAGQINLWAPDNYHASPYGYYLEALTIFGNVTGLNPLSLGANDFVARDIGISPTIAAALQQIASAQLAAERVPEPGMLIMFLTAGGMMFVARKRSAAKV
jgi:hypothetical protein